MNALIRDTIEMFTELLADMTEEKIMRESKLKKLHACEVALNRVRCLVRGGEAEKAIGLLSDVMIDLAKTRQSLAEKESTKLEYFQETAP